MPKHMLVVLSNAVEGRDDEFNDWYTNRHLDDVLQLEGMVAAQRFELDSGEDGPHRYLAIYEADDLETAQRALDAARAERDRAGNTEETLLYRSDAMDSRGAWWFSAISERRTAG